LRFNGHLGHRFIEPSLPSPTVTARGDERGGVVVLHHPNNQRRMTARELAAVQSFPDTFAFVGTKTSAYRQIANAVPPLLGEAIGRMLMAAEAGQESRKVAAA
jgi:DNA (cytosine-5)-methyltransferase 1